MKGLSLWGVEILLILFGSCFVLEANQDLCWENIGGSVVEVNCVWVDEDIPQTIFMGTRRGVFKTEDGGKSWQACLRLRGMNGNGVNLIYVDPKDKNSVFAATSSGLFRSCDQGRTWMRIFSRQIDCSALLVLDEHKIYLGTEAGLFISRDKGKTWEKISGKLSNLSIMALAQDRINNFVYLICSNGVYKIKQDESYERIFVVKPAALNSEETKTQEDEDQLVSLSSIKYICIDPNQPRNLYLATTRGVHKSSDSGKTWEILSDSGLLSKDVRFVAVSVESTIFALTHSEIFAYKQDRWLELSGRLPCQDIRYLALGNDATLYAACDKGLFMSTNHTDKDNYRLQEGIGTDSAIKKEPTIQQIQQAAIKYAQVIDPERIEGLRRGARLKAILPDFSLDYDKTIYGTAGTNTYGPRAFVGPRNWSVSLTWNLSDLIWSEQQRLIDSQVRLMVQLRNDMLDEVTKIYFERKRLQSELASDDLEPKKRRQKELRLEELTASLDGLTGGYLSKFILTE